MINIEVFYDFIGYDLFYFEVIFRFKCKLRKFDIVRIID